MSQKHIRQQIAHHLVNPRCIDVFLSAVRSDLYPRPSDEDILEALKHSPHGISLPALRVRVKTVTKQRLARRQSAAQRQRPRLTHKFRQTFWPFLLRATIRT